MKKYPSISRDILRNVDIFAFDKLDGSNTRAEWNAKRGFYKFGARSRLVDDSDPLLGRMPGVFLEKYGQDLDKLFRKKGWSHVVAFCEFWGPNSFAGQHDPDEQQTVTLIDLAVDKRGILPPSQFIQVAHFVEDIAECLYWNGKANKVFESEVRNRELPGMTFEGVVCKAKGQYPGRPVMFKIKSNAWIQCLREHCKGDERRFRELL